MMQLRENLAVLNQGPLADDEDAASQTRGDMVHAEEEVV